MGFGSWLDGKKIKNALNNRDLSYELDSDKNYDVNKLISKNFSFTPGAKRLYFFMSGWYEDPKHTRFLKRKIIRKGDSYIQYTFEKWILTSNVIQVVKNFKHIRKEFLKDIKMFDGEIDIIGVSLGGIAGYMCANSSPKVSKLISLVPGDRLSQAVFEGIRTSHIGNKIKNDGIPLEKLKKIWREIEPINNLKNFENKSILIFNSKDDKIIPYDRSLNLIKEVLKKNIRCEIHTNRYLGHFGTVFKFYLPFNKYLS
ncbi:MAG: prolyl oligopeptidase family serine peptidase [Nanoarchaeota archaeon]|nr:prolyl oligopeptidase family serine peptidase [Nanoarchaeota archaeon]